MTGCHIDTSPPLSNHSGSYSARVEVLSVLNRLHHRVAFLIYGAIGVSMFVGIKADNMIGWRYFDYDSHRESCVLGPGGLGDVGEWKAGDPGEFEGGLSILITKQLYSQLKCLKLEPKCRQGRYSDSHHPFVLNGSHWLRRATAASAVNNLADLQT